MLRLQANVRVADVLESQVRVRITSIEGRDRPDSLQQLTHRS